MRGSESGLFYEFVRILKLIRNVFGFSFRVKFIAENVASMDASAEGEISKTLGCKPFRVDSADCVPIHRPRFCWHNLKVNVVEGVSLEEKERWVEVSMDHEYPELSQWLEDGAVWEGADWGAVLPTCMKSIRRARPPPSPAGITRVSEASKLRWAADDFRMPPYQYDERFIVWKHDKWRLITADERERLHGFGEGRTTLCWNANQIKADPVGYEDKRKSLVGDGYNCFSFVYFAALACHHFMPPVSYHQLWSRMGMAPGFVAPVGIQVPLCKRLAYGPDVAQMTVQDIHKCLLKRVNHTGSDIRISTGAVFNPKAYPRQSACSAWWKWSKVLAYKWQRPDHINGLELRSIIHAVEWRISHLKETEVRVFHLTDSYVAMSVISKGRSSSSMLKPLLRRLSTYLLTFGVYLAVCHVESLDNPTDDASRS